MMNFRVPDFKVDDSSNRPSSSSCNRQKNLAAEDEIMELLWQNGQVVIQSQNQGYLRKPSSLPPPPQQQAYDPASHLFMQEDEMAALLNYPLDDPQLDRHLYDYYLLGPPPLPAQQQHHEDPPQAVLAPEPNAPSAAALASAPQPPTPPSGRNFPHFARGKGGSRVQNSREKNGARESTTVVESNETPALTRELRVRNAAMSSLDISGGTATGATVGASSSRENMECCGFEMTLSSSTGTSGASVTAAAEPATKPPAQPPSRKLKDVEIESAEAMMKVRETSGGTKRSRAAEVHNLSERKRRDRINEKMRTLKELIPRSTKSDKASMLDEAIGYLKSLQQQVQMMSMGCGMVPMMFPEVQQYMAPMGTGMGMGMGINRPMMSFPHIVPGSGLPTAGPAPHLAPRFPLPTFPMPPVPALDPSRLQANHQADSINQLGLQSSNLPRGAYIVVPYQQFLGMQPRKPQDQPTSGPSTGKPSISRASAG